VAPEHFRGLDRFVPTDAWLPGEELVDSVNYSRGFHNWESFGRMRPGATPDQVSAELDMIGRRLALAYPATNRAATFTGLTETQRIREDFPIYLLLMAAVGLVLLICCANVSGLILVQVESRRKEFAVRLAMGTTRARLIRQFLTEGLILSLSGSALGVMLAAWLVNSERALLPAYSIQIGPDLRIDGRVLAFTMLVTLVATLIFGVIPALHASKADITATLKGQEAGLSRGSRRVSSRNMMVIGQIALAILILSAAGLLIESLNVTMQVPVGFDVQKHLLIVNIAAHAEDEQSTTLLPKTSEAVEGLPGVLHATCAMRMPLTGEGGGNEQRVSIPGFELPRGQENIPVKFNTVSPSYFQTVGTRILKGRTFTGGDSASAPQVVVISATMARRFWPSHDPIGSSLRIEKKGYEIVGVVEDVKINHILEAPEPYIYFPFAQEPLVGGTLIVETAGDPLLWVPAVKQQIRTLDKTAVVRQVFTGRSVIRADLYEQRMLAALVTGMSLLGMFLAAVGLYGVVTHLVNLRSHEIGIRMALGARRKDVLMLVLFQGLKLVLAGLVAGLGMAYAATRLMSGMLFGVTPTDPVALFGGASVACTVALLACCLPARRATMVDPMVALRHE
jgi:putative ABC transport system permease protein